MSKVKFTVVSGKHTKEDGTFVRQGSTIELEETEAAKFPNKFARVMVAAPADAEAEAKTEAKTEAKAPAAPAK